MERLRRLGVLDEHASIVVTADHGESLFDDGFLGHGHMLNDQQTRIPFILSDRASPIPAVIGLDDMRALILGAAGRDRAAADPAGRSSSISAALDRPGAIGMRRRRTGAG